MNLWRNRDFLALWTGQAVSTLGAQLTGTAMPLLVLTMTGSPAKAGLVGAAGTLPFLIGHLPAGTLVDRWNRHRILLTSETVAGLALATIPIAMWTGTLTVAHLAIVAFVQGLCFVFFGVAERAALPVIVEAGQLPSAFAQNEARSRAVALAGPPLGGLLFGAGRALPFVADAVTYLIAAAGLLAVRRDLGGAAAASEPMLRATVAGLRWAWRHRLVRATIGLIALSNLVFQILVLTLVVRARGHGASPAAVGTMLGIYSAGGLLGALAATRLHRHLHPRTVIIGVNWVWAAVIPLFLLTTGAVPIGLVGAACAFVGPLWNVVIFTYSAVLVPGELLGRVTSAAMTLSWGVMPLGSLAGGYLLTTVGAGGTILALTAVMLAAALFATFSRTVRSAPPLTGADVTVPLSAG